MLRHVRGSIAVIVLLAVAIAASLTLTSLFLSVITDRPPIDRPERVVTVWERSATSFRGRSSLTLDQFHEWIAPAAAVARPTALLNARAVVGGADPLFVEEQRVSEHFFDLIGRPPRAGRVFTPEELRRGAAVAMISDALWRRAFGADPTAIGRLIVIDGQPHVLTGVMPRGFFFVFRGAVDVWRPLPAAAPATTTVMVAARLAEAQDPRVLEAIMNAAAPDPAGGRRVEALVTPVSDEFTIRAGPGLVALVGPALLILVCACANAANLLLIANAAREKEFAIRAALGASRARLLRQSLCETLGIVAAAGSAGALLAWWGTSILVRALAGESLATPGSLPWSTGMAACGALAIALPLAGLVPAVSASRTNITAALGGTPRAPRFQRGRYGAFDLLLVLQVGLAVVLVLMSALIVGFGRERLRMTPTFDARVPVIVDVPASPARARTPLVAALERDDRVAAAALATRAPGPSERGARLRAADDAGDRECTVSTIRVTPRYFDALPLTTTDGRALAPAAGGAVASASAVRRCWNSSAGRQLRIVDAAGERWLPVVAVVRDAYEDSAMFTVPQVYVVADEPAIGSGVLIVRPRPGYGARDVREAVRRARPDLPIGSVETLDAMMASRLAPFRVSMMFVGALALLALVIAMTGVASALQHALTLRRVEFGIRLAIGASPRGLVGELVAHDAPLVVAGEAAGLLVTLAATRAYWPDLVAVGGGDPLAWTMVLGVLGSSAIAAAALPIARAMRLDPARLLRAE